MQVNEIISNEVLEIAANWWMDSLQKPKFDNGADDSANRMAQLFAGMLANDNLPEAKQLEVFKTKLVELVQADSLRFSNSHILSVDYHPCELLASAAKEAGINESIFSWKTTMWIYADKIVVRAGYGAPSQVIWQKSE